MDPSSLPVDGPVEPGSVPEPAGVDRQPEPSWDFRSVIPPDTLSEHARRRRHAPGIDREAGR